MRALTTISFLLLPVFFFVNFLQASQIEITVHFNSSNRMIKLEFVTERIERKKNKTRFKRNSFLFEIKNFLSEESEREFWYFTVQGDHISWAEQSNPNAYLPIYTKCSKFMFLANAITSFWLLSNELRGSHVLYRFEPEHKLYFFHRVKTLSSAIFWCFEKTESATCNLRKKKRTHGTVCRCVSYNIQEV